MECLTLWITLVLVCVSAQVQAACPGSGPVTVGPGTRHSTKFTRATMECLTLWITLVLVCVSAQVQGDCGAPPTIPYSLNNGTDADGFPEGAIIRYTCINTFGRRRALYTCHHGNWTGAGLVCRAVECHHPAREHLRLSSIEYSPGSIVMASCDRGYHLVGSEELLCRTDGLWFPDPPHCVPLAEAVMCEELPELEHGWRFQENLDGVNNNYGSVVENYCSAGYQLQGSSSQRCQDNGQWSGEPAGCQVFDCGQPDVGAGDVVGHQRTTLGAMGVIYCNEGATLVGEAYVTCTRDGWTQAYCNAGCVPDELEHGEADESSLRHGDTLHWSCHTGYMKASESSHDVTCRDGELTPPPRCEPVELATFTSGCSEAVSGGQVIKYGGKCYYFLYSLLSKEQARVRCRARYGSRLVSIPDQSTMTFLQTAMRAAGWHGRDVWLGLTYHDNWRWADPGARYGYSNWLPGEGGETVLLGKMEESAVMKGGDNWQWDDVSERLCCTGFFQTYPMAAYAICQGDMDTPDEG